MLLYSTLSERQCLHGIKKAFCRSVGYSGLFLSCYKYYSDKAIEAPLPGFFIRTLVCQV